MGLLDKLLGKKKISNEDKSDRLRYDLNSNSYEVCLKAVEEYANKVKADSKAVDSLIKLAKKEEDPRDLVRKFSMVALGKSQDNRALPLLLDYAENHPDIGTRCMAIVGLGEMGDPAALEVLNKFLSSSNATEKRNAVEALGKIKESCDTDILITKLKDPSIAIKNEAIVALGNLGDTKAVLPIAECYWDLQGDVRFAAKNTWISALQDWKDKGNIEGIIKFINFDEFNEPIVKNIITALESIKGGA